MALRTVFSFPCSSLLMRTLEKSPLDLGELIGFHNGLTMYTCSIKTELAYCKNDTKLW